MATTQDLPGVLGALFGYNRAGRIMWACLFVFGIAGFVGYTMLPGLRFHEQEERLFKAARHGDVAAIEQALADGARIDAESPLDRKTALFRAATFGHAAAVRLLLQRGADPERSGADGKTALQFVEEILREEHDPAQLRGMSEVLAALKDAQR